MPGISFQNFFVLMKFNDCTNCKLNILAMAVYTGFNNFLTMKEVQGGRGN